MTTVQFISLIIAVFIVFAVFVMIGGFVGRLIQRIPPNHRIFR